MISIRNLILLATFSIFMMSLVSAADAIACSAIEENSDAGDSPLKRGYLRLSETYNNDIFIDSCIGENFLLENVCVTETGQLRQKLYHCSDGCLYGIRGARCKGTPVENMACEGQNLQNLKPFRSTSVQVTYDNEEFELKDKCIKGQKFSTNEYLLESFCVGKKAQRKIFQCEIGCNAGACIDPSKSSSKDQEPLPPIVSILVILAIVFTVVILVVRSRRKRVQH